MINASDSEVVQESPRESLVKDSYFVSGIGSGIAKRFKDPVLFTKSTRKTTFITAKLQKNQIHYSQV